MYPQMHFKFIIIWECLFIITSLKLYLPRVCSQIHQIMTIPWKALSHWLHLESFSLMCFFFTCIKKVLLYKIHVTLVVLKWYISSVCLHVYIEVTISWEGHVTLIAVKWFLPTVCYQMSSQVSFNFMELM